MVSKNGKILEKKPQYRYKEYVACKQQYDVQEPTTGWHRYADLLVPLVTIPMLIFIGITLNGYITTDEWYVDQSIRSKVLLLSIAMLIVSFTAFVYVCIRIRPILGGRRGRIRLPMLRNRTHNNLLRSVNSDLHLIVPFNNAPPTYDAIIFNVNAPPCYKTALTMKSSAPTPAFHHNF